MTSTEIALILRWILPLWTLGWLVLPLSSRLFGALPDQGLAVGRVGVLVTVGLAAFWGASLHIFPLRFAPFLLLIAIYSGAKGWKNPAFRAQIRAHRTAFLVSDTVFLLAFGAFLWVRLRHPETNDLEKPMDMALLAAAMRADFLPFENPWFAGQNFTNYYYFGPFLSALLARTFATAPNFAYNLIQPLFCALFLSTLWSLAAALSKSLKIGVFALLLVGLGGHFEPLRQWSQTGKLWPLDWWKTSRVIENTINEYPAFTMLTGDLHAHFFAFCLAATHFCGCFCLLQSQSGRQRTILLLCGGVSLGIFVLTNTWDAPFYALLWFGCALWNRKNSAWSSANSSALVAAFLLAPLVSLPYLLKFKSQVSGVVFNPWLPDLFSFALLWGGWLALGFVALALPDGESHDGETATSSETIFRRFLLLIGTLALIFPFVFYIRGVFGDGDYRHQDTVFKFGLQAWLLIGTGMACEAGFRFTSWWQSVRSPLRLAAIAPVAAFLAVVSLAPACVAWTRVVRPAPREANGKPVLSLNAARFLATNEQESIEWLRRNARPGEIVVEAVGVDAGGRPTGDYDASFGRVAAFSGVPSVLCWPQHVAGWGAAYPEIEHRAALIRAVYQGQNPAQALRELGATTIYFGDKEKSLGAAPRFEAAGSDLEKVHGDNSNGAQIWRLKP